MYGKNYTGSSHDFQYVGFLIFFFRREKTRKNEIKKMAEILTAEVVKPENTESEDHVTKEILQKREARPPKRLTKGTFGVKFSIFF